MAIPQQGEGKFAGHGAAANINGSTLLDEGCEITGQIYWPGGCSLFSGAGAPGSKVNGRPAVVGDIYIRLDGGVGTTLYRCTAAPGTWSAIL